ncbi:hypothetical protein LOK49_LG11G01488 [Camellia lanceoleosa]|uniref:Uncharacterized protein n=1 Tax=Camellia lanceoleosa TaxID=1840588 RepID=A0ACC0G2G0_9ERIC|nr:hypothetical protein LOK49_LG11G01488 [Camellia lanceoleosa]
MAAATVGIFIFSLLFLSTFSHACIPCMPNKPPPNKPPPACMPNKPPPNKPPPACMPNKPPPAAPPVNPFCPIDTLKLGACVDLLGGVVNLVIGSPPSSQCCAVLEGLVDLEVAVCLCTAIKANVLGINLDIPVALSLIISTCGKSIPPGYKCG